MVELRPILLVTGSLLVPLGLGMLIPALVDLAAGYADWQVFALSSGFTLFVGLGLYLATRGASESLDIKQGFLLTALVWVILPAFAALPLMFSQLQMSFTDAYFETMSGLTTTGSTVIVGLDTAPPGILIWRGFLQWLGGIGIIVMAIAVLPMLKVGGMQLFRTESSDTSEKILPRMTQFAGAITGVYVTISILCFVSLFVAGMSPFEAIVHTMTSVSTGGYSTSDQSISYFDSAAIDYILVFFMIISSLPYVLYIQLARGRGFLFWKDDQVRTFALFLVLATGLICSWLWLGQGFEITTAFRVGIFNTVSLITTTGYANAAFDTWGPLALGFFFVISFLGGCAGSSSGAIKAFRFRVLFAALDTQIKKISRPHAVYHPKFNGQPIGDKVFESVLGFLFLFAVSYICLVILLALTGLDYLTVLSGVAATLTNVGPGLGEIIGPAGTYKPLPDTAKWILSFAMLLGRLELLTVLILFTPGFWRS